MESLQTEPIKNETVLSSRWIWILGAFVLLLLVGFGGFFTSYKKVTKENETLMAQKQTLEKELESWKNKTVNRETFFANGRIKSRTTIEDNEGLRSREDSHTVTTTDIKSKEVTITKRGLVSVGLLWSDKGFKPVGASVQATVLGPFSCEIVGFYDPFTVYPGIAFSF